MEGMSRILLIDELPDDREIYGRGLAMLGFTVTTLTEAQARAAALTPLPDVIVLHLAHSACWELCDDLRRLYGPVPVIVLTAAVRPDRLNRERARATINCAGFVGKPCTHLELGAVVSRVLSGERRLEFGSGREAC